MDTAIIRQPEIAIVEDHPPTREALCNLLTRSGFLITIVSEDGKQFIEALHSADHLPEVCLVDLRMPVMNGYDTIKAIHARWPQIKMIACSNHAVQKDIDLALSLGANLFYQKNSAPGILMAWIKEATTDRTNST